MKKIANLSLLVLCFTFSDSISNAQDSTSNKFLMALYYLRTNVDVNKKVIDFFPKRINKKTSVVDFNLSNNVAFISYSDFEKHLTEDFRKELKYGEVFLEKHFYKPYKSAFLERLAYSSESALSLYFSKPINNYLIAELGFFETDKFIKRKYGIAMKILFRFNKEGFVEEVYYSGSTYN